MKQNTAKRLLIASAGTGLLLLLLWHASLPPTFYIQGRSLDQHILRANNGDGDSRKILDTLTPDAIPHLTGLLRSGASPASRLYLSFWLKLKPDWRVNLPPPQYDVRADALSFLSRFGPAAASAVNEITNYLAQTEPFTMGRHACYETLYYIGSAASNSIPILLLKTATPDTTDPSENFLAPWTLAKVGQGSHPTAEVLESVARGTNAPVERIACALASHAILPNQKLITQVIDPLIQQWLAEVTNESSRAQLTAHRNLTIVSDMIGSFGSPAKYAADRFRINLADLQDRQLRLRLLSGLQGAGDDSIPEA